MKWYEKFKVGQKVKVIKKISLWCLEDSSGQQGTGTTWVTDMDKTIGKTFEVIEIDSDIGYRLNTRDCVREHYNYWYSPDSLEKENVKGKQLEFNFMQEEG